MTAQITDLEQWRRTHTRHHCDLISLWEAAACLHLHFTCAVWRDWRRFVTGV